MAKLVSNQIMRPLIARDGTVYYIRRLHVMGKSKGVYIPRKFYDALRWKRDDPLMMWVQGDVLCVKVVELNAGMTRLIPVPPRGERPDKVGPDEEA